MKFPSELEFMECFALNPLSWIALWASSVS